MAEAPAPAPSAEDELATKILRQVEYYFSDDSYPFDEYIQSQETEGWARISASRHANASSPGEQALTDMLHTGPPDRHRRVQEDGLLHDGPGRHP